MNYLLQIVSRALPGRDDEYNKWYDNQHVGDVLSLEGFNACTRYRRCGPGAGGPAEYVAIYEVETNDPAALMQQLLTASQNMVMTDSIDLTSARFEFLEPIGKGRVAAG